METNHTRKLRPHNRSNFLQNPVSVISAPFFIAALAAAVLFAALLAGCLGTGSILESAFFPGAYEGKGQGYRGPIYVRIELSPAGIEDIVITDHREGAYPGAAAMEELLDLVLETGSTDLDAVSGATYSSRGFLEAVDDALAQAREKIRDKR